MAGPWEQYQQASDGPWAKFAAKKQDMKAVDPSEYDPTSDAYQKKYGPTSSSSYGENVRASAGKMISDVWSGFKQRAAEAKDLVSIGDPARLAMALGNGTWTPSADAARAAATETKAQDAPLMRAPGSTLGYLGAGLATGIPLSMIPGGNTENGAALMGAGLGFTQPTADGENPLMNALTSAGLAQGGQWLGSALSNKARDLANQWRANKAAAAVPPSGTAQAGVTTSATPGVAAATNTVTATPTVSMSGGGAGFGSVGEDISKGLTQAQKTNLESGLALGMRATPGQATGSRALQQFEAKLESQPMTSGPFNTIKANNARVLGGAAAKSIGETGTEVSSSVLDNATDRIGSVFNKYRDATPRGIDPKGFVGALQNLNNEYEGLLPLKQIADHPLVNKLVDFAKEGSATGEQLGNLSSKLGKVAATQMTSANGDRQLGMALFDVKNYVDDLFEQGLSPVARQEVSTARQQYRNLMLLTQRQGVVNPSSGDVRGGALAALLQQKDRKGFLLGKNTSDLYTAARFAQGFPSVVGDSGTATRSMVTNPVEMLASIPFNIATRLYTSSPAIRIAMQAQAASQAGGRAVGPLAAVAEPYFPMLTPGLAGLAGVAPYPK